jgi:hypothetical protein
MDLTKLLTMRFDRNVGTADRVARVAGGAAVMAAGWLLAVPAGYGIATTVFGFMTALSGLASRCTIYYALGYSSCPLREERDRKASALGPTPSR